MPNHFEGFLFHVNFEFKIFCLKKSNLNLIDHSFGMNAKSSEKLTFFIPMGKKCCSYGKFCVGIKWTIPKQSGGKNNLDNKIKVPLYHVMIIMWISCDFVD